MNSGVRYIDKNFSTGIAPLLREHFSRQRMLYEYIDTIYENKLERRKALYPKHYFYMLRPLLAALWVISRREPAPVLFDTLREMLPDNLQPYINFLIGLRLNAPEKIQIERIYELDAFMYGTYRMMRNAYPKNQYDDNRPLMSWYSINKFFREVIGVE